MEYADENNHNRCPTSVIVKIVIFHNYNVYHF
jgi:hypothetical protein